MDETKKPTDAETFWWATGKTSIEGGIEEEERRWSDGSPTGLTRWFTPPSVTAKERAR